MLMATGVWAIHVLFADYVCTGCLHACVQKKSTACHRAWCVEVALVKAQRDARTALTVLRQIKAQAAQVGHVATRYERSNRPVHTGGQIPVATCPGESGI